MSGKWQVYKPRIGNWHGRWIAESPQHISWVFASWVDAMRWADPVGRLEVWLSMQPKPRMGYFGQPADRDDQGRPL